VSATGDWLLRVNMMDIIKKLKSIEQALRK
jgi:hypothetical protein